MFPGTEWPGLLATWPLGPLPAQALMPQAVAASTYWPRPAKLATHRAPTSADLRHGRQGAGGEGRPRAAGGLPPPGWRQEAERLGYCREILRGEAAGVELVAQRLDGSFLRAGDCFYRCAGRNAVTGTGKSADVGQK